LQNKERHFNMASLLARLFGLHDNRRDARWDEVLPAPAHRPAPAPVAAPTSAELLPPLKNWCHPFKDTRQPLEQLTHLANAKAGYYPIGRSGLFHGGVHFDSGTGVTPDKSVHCLADGEVVAYRVDTQSPTTRYFINTLTVDKPFSRNFVLVRHRMQPPRINGSPDTPPSLTFYSLYMHLRDWQLYQTDPATTRPAFWPPSPTLRVKQTAKDVRPGQSEARGLNVRHADNQGQIIDLLPRGAEVTVSGVGRYRKLENSPGPADLINADGSLKGYIAASLLQPMAGNEYRIQSSKASVYVRAEPVKTSRELRELPTGTVVTVSGEGEYRKLERVNQYVYFDMLEAEPEPLALDRIVVLDQPVPIKAAALIGHLGEYQDSGADLPEEKLHLEVFTDVEEIDLFLKDSRAWAKRLPDKDRTLLKLAKGTPVVAHQDNATAAQLKARSSSSPLSAADLLVPKTLLDGLPAERKIHVPASGSHNARHWYHLGGLLHDANNTLLNGWVCEEVGVTPWFSPWSWEGYDLIFDYNTSRHAMASFFSAVDRFTEAQRERFRPLAEEDLKGPMKSRLYDIIDRNRDGKLTADELQAALRLPAHAQAISQMILYKESEWFHNTRKWDALDELLGHSGSTPHLNWVAEKQRIEQMGWWGEVAKKLGVSSWGKAYHFHPVGLSGWFNINDRKITVELLEKVTGKSGSWFTGRGGGRTFIDEFQAKYPLIYKYDKYKFVAHLNDALERYKITSPHQQAHFVAQCFHESAAFETTVEFASGEQYDPGRHVNAIASGNAEVGDGPKYKGKGLIQLTWKNNYASYSAYRGVDFVRSPDLIAESMFNAIDVSCWYWRRNGAVSRRHNARGDINVLIDNEPANVRLVTLAVNGGDNGLHERIKIYEAIAKEWGLSE
jgi:predicted chitinase